MRHQIRIGGAALTRRVTFLAVAVLALAAQAAAQQVFDGDPIDPATGRPYLMLPGAPLFAPGDDEKYGTDDDTLDTGTAGDVDLVVRTVAFGASFPAPANGVAAAPVVVAGGAATGHGTDAPFQVGVSDGASTPAAGNLLTSSDLDGRGVVVLAYADLDGDGVLGPTAADGNADAQVELQEILVPVGRQVASIVGGDAGGSIGVSLGAPASAGGLGTVVVAAALAGVDPPLYDDGNFVTTLLPLLPPVDVKRIVTGNARPPDPEYLVDLELDPEIGEAGRWFLPSPGDPVLGEPYAIPLDGSSVTVDLLQARGGAATGARLARPIDASFAAGLTRRLLPAVGSGGSRLLLEDVENLALPDDGPGNPVSVAVFAADLLGNPTDPTPGGMTTVVEVGPGLAILSPDGDGDPQRETVVLANAEAVLLTIDDAGIGGGGGAERITVLRDGVPTSSIAVTLEGSGTPGLGLAKVVLRLAPPDRNVVRVKAKFTGAGLDMAAQDVTVTLISGAQTIYSRTFPAGSLEPKSRGNRYVFRDPHDTGAGRALLVVSRRSADPSTYTARLMARNLALAGVVATVDPVIVVLQVGSEVFQGQLACVSNVAGTAARCAL